MGRRILTVLHVCTAQASIKHLSHSIIDFSCASVVSCEQLSEHGGQSAVCEHRENVGRRQVWPNINILCTLKK